MPKIVTMEDVKKDDELLKKIVDQYNKTKENARKYYYKVNNKEPRERNKTEDMKEYQKEYRLKLKNKRNQAN